ncbi:hypothetical protein [Campylobacter sp.]|uniref:coiled-coil domain-containing protein n=1 Tax=Campylobacter sp. TaxID=205 RepID=UPI0025C0A4EF|nr:hypothetical protein [Campylobacter sp.]
MNQNYKKLVVMNRGDGTGSRLFSMINAMAVADKLSSLDNMRFLWNETRFVDKSEQADANNTKMRGFKDTIIIGASCECKESIFKDSFIKKHFLEKYESDNQIYPVKDINKLKELYNKSDYLKIDIGYLDFLYSNKFEYRSKLATMWDKIEFNDNIVKMINLARQHAAKLDNFIAIHLRSGDAIYTYANYRLCNRQSTDHVTPYEFALGIIEQHKNENIIIIGDDISSMRTLKQIANNNNVKLIEEFRDIDKYSNLELFIYDVVFMSKATLLYGTHSALVKLAYGINPNLKWIHPHNDIDIPTLYKWLQTHYRVLDNLSPSQRAYSCFCLFMYGEKCNEKLEILEKYLQNALEFDPENDKYRIHIVNCLLKKQDVEQSNCLLSNYLTNRFNQFNRLFVSKYWSGKYAFEEVFNNFIIYANPDYPYISFMAAKASEALGKNDGAITCYKYAKKELYDQSNICLLNLFDIQLNIMTQNLTQKNIELKKLQDKSSELQLQLDEKTKENIQMLSKFKSLEDTLNSISIKKQSLEISNLEQDLINKKLKAQILEKELSIKIPIESIALFDKVKQELNKISNEQKSNKELLTQIISSNMILQDYVNKENLQDQSIINQNQNLIAELLYCKEQNSILEQKLAPKAKSRIHNQLSYKLGQAMIENSKSIWGYIRMPYVLSYIKDMHKKEQIAYNEKIKANPSLKLPPLESYPDYKEALKEKECLTYKLGEAMIIADKSPLKLGYITLWFKCKNIQRECKKR